MVWGKFYHFNLCCSGWPFFSQEIFNNHANFQSGLKLTMMRSLSKRPTSWSALQSIHPLFLPPSDSLTCFNRKKYKDTLKYGFYKLQSMRDWYLKVTSDACMQVDLITHWIRIAALLVTPTAPHFSEHIWPSILKNPQSIPLTLWPTPSKYVDCTLIEAGSYMHEMIGWSLVQSIACTPAMWVLIGRSHRV